MRERENENEQEREREKERERGGGTFDSLFFFSVGSARRGASLLRRRIARGQLAPEIASAGGPCPYEFGEFTLILA